MKGEGGEGVEGREGGGGGEGGRGWRGGRQGVGGGEEIEVTPHKGNTLNGAEIINYHLHTTTKKKTQVPPALVY